MNWLRSNYDRVAVIAGAAFLFLCAFFIWQRAANFQDAFANLRRSDAPKVVAPTEKAREVDSAASKLQKPPQWIFGGRSGLFVPEKHFIGPDGLPATLRTTEVHPPVPNEWLEQYGLPLAEADVLNQDPDGDGFSNLEEWEGHTDPTQKHSHAAFVTKLKLKSFTREPFRFVFASRTGDTYGINTSDLKEPTQFLQVGDAIRGTKFKIVGFTPKSVRNQYGTEVDVSELTIENIENNERLNLVKEKIMTSPESVGTFVYSWGERRELVIKKDQEFSLPPETETSYKLSDVAPGGAVIVPTKKPEERIEIGLLVP